MNSGFEQWVATHCSTIIVNQAISITFCIFIILFIFSFRLGYLFYDQEKWLLSITFFKLSKLIIFKSEDKKSINILIGNCYAELANSNKAIDYYNKILKTDPKDYLANKNIGLAYIDKGDWQNASAYFSNAYTIKYGLAFNQGNIQQNYNSSDNEIVTGKHKLKHDIEQLKYLIKKELLPDSFGQFIDNYKNVLLEIANHDKTLVTLNNHQKNLIGTIYDKNLYFEKNHEINLTINPENDFNDIKRQYLKNFPGYVYFDNFLTEEVVIELTNFCLNSTIWHEYRRSRGYLASYMDNGFSSPLLYQIAADIKGALPDIFKDYLLMNMWAFKYDSSMAGVVTHADQAMINVNFWITPDSANLNTESGGIVLYDKEAPANWNFEKYNKDTNLIHDFLDKHNAKSQVIPYKQNRVIIFNSGLFHETDNYSFKEGYENRRINITLLFGKRK